MLQMSESIHIQLEQNLTLKSSPNPLNMFFINVWTGSTLGGWERGLGSGLRCQGQFTIPPSPVCPLTHVLPIQKHPLLPSCHSFPPLVSISLGWCKLTLFTSGSDAERLPHPCTSLGSSQVIVNMLYSTFVTLIGRHRWFMVAKSIVLDCAVAEFSFLSMRLLQKQAECTEGRVNSSGIAMCLLWI